MRGLYVHVPWCTARCGSCDFNTCVAPKAGLTVRGRLPANRVVLALTG